MLTLERAAELNGTMVTEEHLIIHAKNVSYAMGAMAEHFGEDREHWEAVGLLQDYDYEKNPEEHLQHTKEPLLAAVPVGVGGTGERTLPRWLWRFLLWLWRFFGAGKQPAVDQAERLIQKLETTGEDCILICQVSFAKILLDRFRRHGGVITRGGVFRLRPLEQILITRRDMHCGGCQHNCLLSNPGCGVGRDKAARKSG